MPPQISLTPLPGTTGAARVPTARGATGLTPATGAAAALPYAPVTTNREGGMSAGPAAQYTNALTGAPQPGDQRFVPSTGPGIVVHPLPNPTGNKMIDDLNKQRAAAAQPENAYPLTTAAIAANNPPAAGGGTGAGTGTQGMAQALTTTALNQGNAIGAQGQQVRDQTLAQANDLFGHAQAGGITSQNVAAGAPPGAAPPGPQQGGMLGAQGPYAGSLPTGAAPPVQSTPGSFQVGQRLPTGPAPVAPRNVAGSSALGAVRDVVNAPNIANQLNGAPQVGNVAGVAGQLGAGPQVGNVANIRAGAAPGAVTPQLGNFGQQNAEQQGMLGRVNQFLDAPQGPSVAEAQLRQSQADTMGALIGAAHSGRGGAGSTAQALRGAQSEGSAVMSDTAGQLATLRAQEEDMRKNRDLSAIGLGGNLATAQRQQDLGFRGQDLQSLQGDQSTSLGARGQDLSASLANQQTQTALEGLRAQTGIAARGQNLSALQGDQGTSLGLEGLRASTALGARGQNLSALGMDAGNQLAAQQLGVQRDLGQRGQNLQALQGDQSTGLGMQGLGVQRELGLRGQDVTTRAQDLSALTSDADRNLAAQGLGVQRELGLTNAGLTAQGQGLNFQSNANSQNLAGTGLAAQTFGAADDRWIKQYLGEKGIDIAQQQINNQPNGWEMLAGNLLQVAGPIVGGAVGGPPGAVVGAGLGTAAKTGLTQGNQVQYDSNGYPISDERAKTDITPLESVKRAASSPIADFYRQGEVKKYRYKADSGEDTSVEHWGRMVQDFEKTPLGRSIVKAPPGQKYKRVDAARLALVNDAGLVAMRSELDELRKLLVA